MLREKHCMQSGKELALDCGPGTALLRAAFNLRAARRDLYEVVSKANRTYAERSLGDQLCQRRVEGLSDVRRDLLRGQQRDLEPQEIRHPLLRVGLCTQRQVRQERRLLGGPRRGAGWSPSHSLARGKGRAAAPTKTCQQSLAAGFVAVC